MNLSLVCQHFRMVTVIPNMLDSVFSRIAHPTFNINILTTFFISICIVWIISLLSLWLGYCQGDGYRVGFGRCMGTILPALQRWYKLLSHGAIAGILLWSTTDLKLTYLHYLILLWQSLSMNDGNSLSCPRFRLYFQFCRFVCYWSWRYLLISLEPITAAQGSVLWIFLSFLAPDWKWNYTFLSSLCLCLCFPIKSLLD